MYLFMLVQLSFMFISKFHFFRLSTPVVYAYSHFPNRVSEIDEADSLDNVLFMKLPFYYI